MAPIQSTPQTSTLVESQGQTLEQESTTRRDWIKECRKAHPERSEPCSAKSVYRLADRLLFCLFLRFLH